MELYKIQCDFINISFNLSVSYLLLLFYYYYYFHFRYKEINSAMLSTMHRLWVMEWTRNPSMANFKPHILSITLCYFVSKYKLIAIITAKLYWEVYTGVSAGLSTLTALFH